MAVEIDLLWAHRVVGAHWSRLLMFWSLVALQRRGIKVRLVAKALMGR